MYKANHDNRVLFPAIWKSEFAKPSWEGYSIPMNRSVEEVPVGGYFNINETRELL